jgi:hypothetical protein
MLNSSGFLRCNTSLLSQGAYLEWLIYYTLTTLVAWGPLGPSMMSKLTSSPSFKDLNPSSFMAEKWTKISLPPSFCSMKPNPLASLNHFTLPVAKLFTTFHKLEF